MRVLVAHNRYQQRGGEDSVVESEVELLRRNGDLVTCYFRDNKDVNTLAAGSLAAQTLWSRRTTEDVSRLIERFRPDVMHVHNTFPLISPSIYWLAQSHRIPVVQTLHNFRLICPQAMLLRNEKPCESCVGRAPWRAVIHRCYRGSARATAVVSAMITTHRILPTWQKRVTRYIALNDFCKSRFVAGGLPADRISIKPNFVDIDWRPSKDRQGFIFVGRLSKEKGIKTLMAASSLARLAEPILVVGQGSEENNIPSSNAGIILLGSLRSEDVYTLMRASLALVMPSIWYENFPRTIVEAYACGLPVIASRLGALPSLVIDGVTGLLFTAGDSHDLADKLVWANKHRNEMAQMGLQARKHYETHLTGASNYRQLLDIYREAQSSI